MKRWRNPVGREGLVYSWESFSHRSIACYMGYLSYPEVLYPNRPMRVQNGSRVFIRTGWRTRLRTPPHRPLLCRNQQDLAAGLVGLQEITSAELLLLQDDPADTGFRRCGGIDHLAFERAIRGREGQRSLVAARISDLAIRADGNMVRAIIGRVAGIKHQ